MSAMPPVADWLPRALRDAPRTSTARRACSTCCSPASTSSSELLAADIDQLWDDLFIESCADWAVPYIGALVGLPPDAEPARGRLRDRAAPAQGHAGRARGLRRGASTGLTARVLEGWQITVWAQRLGHPPPPARRLDVDLADGSRFRIGTPFDRVRRSVTPSGP